MRTHPTSSSIRAARLGAVAALLLAVTAFSACQSSGQTGLLAGAGIGALAGQAIGGNTTATLIGTGVGAGVGYVIGNERDRAQAREMTARQQRELDDLRRRQEAAERQAAADRAAPPPTAAPPIPGGAAQVSGHDQTGPLAGTRWTVVNLSPRDVAEPFLSMIVEFRAGGRVVSTVTRPDGTVDVHNERYRVVGDTLIMNANNYLVNARFAVDGDELVISADRFSAVLRRLAS